MGSHVERPAPCGLFAVWALQPRRAKQYPLRLPVRGQGDEAKPPCGRRLWRVVSAQDPLSKVRGQERELDDPRRLVTSEARGGRERQDAVGTSRPQIVAPVRVSTMQLFKMQRMPP